jgi:mannose-1-phosphate guanylyltransferase
MPIGSGRLWSIVLAGGEGERTRAFIERWLGYHRPKQYCTFTGTRSLFQQTVDRADAPSVPARRVIVAAEDHQDIVREQLGGRGMGRLLLQPHNRGTAPGVFLALAYVLGRDPKATVVIYPSDHFVHPEKVFLDVVRTAVRNAESAPDKPVLLGVLPSSSEGDYGWIVPSSDASDGATRRVEAFVEKPSGRLAEQAMERGGLWNTMIVASRASALWALGVRYLPEMMPAFVRLWEAFPAGREKAILDDIYRSLPSRDFSTDLLQRGPDRLKVLEMTGVFWSDWGRPERILETLRRLDRVPLFPEAAVLDPSFARSTQRRQEVSHVP